MEEFSFSIELLDATHVPREQREAEWLRVYRHFGPRLDSFYRNRLSSAMDVDELLADIWRRTLANIGTLRSPRAMWSWLTTIGNNLIRDNGRRQAVRAKHEIQWSDAEADQGLRLFLAVWADHSQHGSESDIHEKFEHLSAEDREFLELFAVDKLGHQEIAQRLGMVSASASRQRLCRLRKRLTGGLE
jgi:RNA polymerase sigma factor (sigma-70 family)